MINLQINIPRAVALKGREELAKWCLSNLNERERKQIIHHSDLYGTDGFTVNRSVDSDEYFVNVFTPSPDMANID